MPDADLVIIQPLNTVQMWSGLLVDIPKGWQLCDGTNGTPDLVASFVKGAPDVTDAGATGGEDEHTLTVTEMPSHTHTTLSTGGGLHNHNPSSNQVRTRTGIDNGRPGSGTSGAFRSGLIDPVNGTFTIGTTGGAPHENRPAFFELAYIMRLS